MTSSKTSDTASLLTRAVAMHGQGRANDAAQIYRQILAVDGNHVDALHLLGVTRLQSGDAAEAVALIDRALAIDPANSSALNNSAVALSALGRHGEAVTRLDRALALKPDDAEAMFNRGNAWRDNGRPDLAVADYERAAASRPTYTEAHLNLGLTFERLNRLDDARGCLDRAVASNPRHAGARYNRGLLLRNLGKVEAAVPEFAAAADLAPPNPEAQVALAESFFALDRYDIAWPFFEWRWQTAGLGPRRRVYAKPQLTNDMPVAGRTILVHAEQGFGDTLQFSRFVPALAARGATVIFAVQPELRSLLARRNDGVQVIDLDTPPPPFDLHCPLLSLPGVLNVAVADIAAVTTPYVAADPDLVRQWRARFAARSRPCVGLIWSSSNLVSDPPVRNRNMPLVALTPLATCPVDTIGLLPEIGTGRHAAVGPFPALAEAAGLLKSFDDTAAAIVALDLVISIDTAAAHVAGALGRPVWLMLPFAAEWRWTDRRRENLWYPQARIFRQPKSGDWPAVAAAVAAALKEKFKPAS